MTIDTAEQFDYRCLAGEVRGGPGQDGRMLRVILFWTEYEAVHVFADKTNPS